MIRYQNFAGVVVQKYRIYFPNCYLGHIDTSLYQKYYCMAILKTLYKDFRTDFQVVLYNTQNNQVVFVQGYGEENTDVIKTKEIGAYLM